MKSRFSKGFDQRLFSLSLAFVGVAVALGSGEAFAQSGDSAGVYCHQVGKKKSVAFYKGLTECPARTIAMSPGLLTGVRGERGAPGLQGPAGPRGEAGARGPQGERGAQGLAGLQGPAGPRGEAGPQGLPGSVGPSGPAGGVGPQGPAGPAGPAGPVGPAGAIGPRGLQGEPGRPGPGLESAGLNVAGTLNESGAAGVAGCGEFVLPEFCFTGSGCRLVVSLHDKRSTGGDELRGVVADVFGEIQGLSQGRNPGLFVNVYNPRGTEFSGNLGSSAKVTLLDLSFDGVSSFKMTNYKRRECPGMTSDGPIFAGFERSRVSLWVRAGFEAVVRFVEN